MSNIETFISVNKKTKGNWFTLIEYSLLKDISISTIRRKIKSGELEYKITRGKYLIRGSNDNIDIGASYIIEIKRENDYLRNEVNKLREEIQDLIMLGKMYEKKLKEENEKD